MNLKHYFISFPSAVVVAGGFVEQWGQIYFVWCKAVIDKDGFRPNVGIILANSHGQVLWAKRLGWDAWQFPQGGIDAHETPEEALFRELKEEIGLSPEHVEVLACTRGWLRYRLPKRMIRQGQQPLCIGQKQKWFLLRMLAPDATVQTATTNCPEFDSWEWVSYWYPVDQVVSFKREVYRRAMKELCLRHSRLVYHQGLVIPSHTKRS